MSNDDLFKFEHRWETTMGLVFPGERVVFRDKDLFTEFSNKSWMELLLYGVTGREFSKKQIQLFDSIWTICTSYPDPRIWNNRVSSLAGTARSTACLAVGASSAMSEALLYGRRPDIRAIDFFYRAQEQIENNKELSEIVLSELKNFRAIFGYARPIVKEDERIKPLVELAHKLGLANGKYLKLVFDVEKILSEGRWRKKANIAAVAAGLAADQGLTPREYYNYLLVSFSIGFTTCFIDAAEKPENMFFPFRCNRIKYEGSSIREW
ncbi:MAG: hypothetical protein GKR92_05625 [Gammaproteobacteria bacterium]|nr:MAG: hypothetical protein GKR92_05625 [Gammaproteobacteria bacterium]